MKVLNLLKIGMKITNPRVLLLENIRQSCVYKLNSSDRSKYWDYMTNFSTLCADVNEPNFNEDCSKSVLSLIGQSSSDIDDCIKTAIKGI